MSKGHAHVVTPVSTLFFVFGTLFVLTIATVLTARMDLGALNTPIALGIAVCKASLVVIYFMAVRYNTPLTKVAVVAGFFWVLSMFGLTIGDYLTRTSLGVPGR